MSSRDSLTEELQETMILVRSALERVGAIARAEPVQDERFEKIRTARLAAFEATVEAALGDPERLFGNLSESQLRLIESLLAVSEAPKLLKHALESQAEEDGLLKDMLIEFLKRFFWHVPDERFRILILTELDWILFWQRMWPPVPTPPVEPPRPL